MNIGVFGCDPGGHTGCAWGVLDPGAKGGVAEALQNRINAGSSTVTGDERTQIREVATLWQSFYRACVQTACMPPDRLWFVMENFILKPGETAGGKDSTIPLALIWGIEGYRMGRADEWKQSHPRGKQSMPTMILQMAGQAKGYATGARLKEWDVWVRGREHERSAWSHIAYFLQHYMIQRGSS